MRLLVAVLLSIGCSAYSMAKDNFFVGTWSAGGEAAMSILGDLEITPTSITWYGSRSSPKCRTSYKVVDETRGKKPYPDEGWPSKDIASEAIFETAKVRLAPAKCIGTHTYFRFVVASDSRGHLDIVDYNELDQPSGWFSFGRIK